MKALNIIQTLKTVESNHLIEFVNARLRTTSKRVRAQAIKELGETAIFEGSRNGRLVVEFMKSGLSVKVSSIKHYFSNKKQGDVEEVVFCADAKDPSLELNQDSYLDAIDEIAMPGSFAELVAAAKLITDNQHNFGNKFYA